MRKQEKPKLQVEGYIDNERGIFVITNDNGLLTSQEPERIIKEYQDVRELLEKYKPNFK